MNNRAILYLFAVTVIGVFFGWFYFSSVPDMGTRTASGPVESLVSDKNDKGESLIATAPVSSGDARDMLRAVEILPQKATVLDSLTVSVKPNPHLKGVPSYEYRWFINEKHVENAVGSTLAANSFRKFNRIIVEVTPSLGGAKGFPMRSGVRIIGSASPDVFLNTSVARASESISLQLIGSDPDGDQVTYSLEAPFLDGMKIDAKSGKIEWKYGERPSGDFRFGASVMDIEGNRTSKVFHFTVAK